MKEPTFLRLIENTILENQRIPIIVEGLHDVSSLREIGFTGDIIKLNNGLSLHAFCQSVVNRSNEVIMLADFGRKGVELQGKISSLLSTMGCSVNNTLWDYIRKNYNIKSVEDLPYLHRKSLGLEDKSSELKFIRRLKRKQDKI